MADDEVLEFDFEGVAPAVFGTFVAMPKGEYTLQCIGCRKFFTGESQGKADPNRPNLEFLFSITNHPTFEGKELKLNHSLLKDSRQFLLNTLQCLLPDLNWAQDGIKIPLSTLIQKVQGRPANGLVDWEINVSKKNGKKYVNNNLNGLKSFDMSITQPVPTEGNPPIVTNEPASQITQQAAGGVSPGEVNEFLNQWPSGTPQTPAPSEGNFFSDPF